MKQVFLIKLSGEAMSGKLGYGLDFEYIEKICRKIKDCHDLGVGIGIVCGGGNFVVVNPHIGTKRLIYVDKSDSENGYKKNHNQLVSFFQHILRYFLEKYRRVFCHCISVKFILRR